MGLRKNLLEEEKDDEFDIELKELKKPDIGNSLEIK